MVKGRKPLVKNSKSVRDQLRVDHHPGLVGDTRLDKLFFDANKRTTSVRLADKRAIFERVVGIVDISGSIVELEARLLEDFPAWCAFHLDARTGDALFLSPWQQEFCGKMFRNRELMTFCSRRSGKSTATPAGVLFYMCKNDHRQVVFFAPTKDQDFCYQSARKMLVGSKSLMDLYADNKPAMERFELKNGSAAINRTIGLQQQGKLARGESGDLLIVDEFQLVPKNVMNEVIKPILADMYSTKSLILIGTPDERVNPNLSVDWAKACSGEKEGITVMHVPWQRAVREGCISIQHVRDAKEEMLEEEFMREYEAKFPESGGSWYERERLVANIRPGLGWATSRDGLGKLVMGIDWAKEHDRTEILISEVLGDKDQKYVFWNQIDPSKGKMDYTTQITYVKGVYWKYKPNIIVPDSTGQQDVMIELLTSGPDAIPLGVFFKEDRGKDDDKYGFLGSGVRNYNAHKRHKKYIEDGRIHVPDDENFYDQWVDQHNMLLSKPIMGGTALGFDNSKGKFKDLCVVSAMISYVIGKDKGPACHYVGMF